MLSGARCGGSGSPPRTRPPSALSIRGQLYGAPRAQARRLVLVCLPQARRRAAEGVSRQGADLTLDRFQEVAAVLARRSAAPRPRTVTRITPTEALPLPVPRWRAPRAARHDQTGAPAGSPRAGVPSTPDGSARRRAPAQADVDRRARRIREDHPGECLACDQRREAPGRWPGSRWIPAIMTRCASGAMPSPRCRQCMPALAPTRWPCSSHHRLRR